MCCAAVGALWGWIVGDAGPMTNSDSLRSEERRALFWGSGKPFAGGSDKALPDASSQVRVDRTVERAVIQKRDDPIVMFKIKQEELELRRLAMARGAKYDGRNYMWRLCRSEVLRMGLKSWIAVTDQDPGQEQVRP